MHLIGFAVCLLLLVSSNTHASAPRPNILLIMVDDLGWRDLSCYGSTFYQTVNIDRLAKEGVAFTQAYAAYPRCGGARYGIMAGKSPSRVGGDTEIEFGKPDVSIGQAFKDAGYATFYCGKWFLGNDDSLPDKHGFTKTIGTGNATSPQSYFAPYNNTRTKGTPKPAIRGLDDAPKGQFLPDRLTDETIQFIRANKDRPFFAVLSHYALYAPLEAKEGYVTRYRKRLQEMGQATGRDWEAEGSGRNKLKQNDPVYAAMLHSIDEGVGRILDLLSEFKVADRTVVLLCSDVGGFSCQGTNSVALTSNRPLRAGKCHLYEGGIRIPLIVKWPGFTKGGPRIEVPIMTTDLYPTFLEMAGLPPKPEQHLDGRSFAALLKKPELKQLNPERCFFWLYPAPRPGLAGDTFCNAVRCAQYKLLDFYKEGRMELYDLDADVAEFHNLVEKLSPKAAELKAKLDAWQSEINAQTPTQPPKPKPKKK